MIRKILLAVTLLSACSYAAVPTTVDTVLVPVKILQLNGITTQGTTPVYDYYGKVNYNFHVGDNDSLNVSLDFVPVGGGTTVTPYWDSGAVGAMSFINGMNGPNPVYFKCKITGQPAAQYTARITINAGLSRIETVTDSLLGLMTTQQKVDQLHGTGSARVSPDIPSLGIPGYYMSNGPSSPCVGVSGTSTAFPTACAMSCTFDTSLIDSMGAVLAQEFYAKGIYILEGPMTNMVRDLRGGRDWETFSEDPYLSAQMCIAYSRGVQSVKCIVMPKHYICNDMEANRTTYTSNISERTLREIYAMPFEYAIKDGKAWSVMSSYNKVNSTYCSENPHTLTDILKNDWGFRGFVCSDLGAMHSTVNAANAGQDVELYNATYFSTPLLNAVTAGQVTMDRLNDMAKRILRLKVWAGLIGKIGESAVVQYAAGLNSAAHQALALQVAQKSIVVVKNAIFGTETVPVLPLDKTKTVSLVGPFAATVRTDPGGGSSGKNCPYVTTLSPLSGIRTEIGTANVLDSTLWRTADIVIACLGVSGEGEGADRTTATLEPPANQTALVNTIVAAGKKCIVVLTGGSAAVQDAWSNVPGVVVAWYAGEMQGTALAQILYGDVNPSGRLSSSWPAAAGQLPAFSSANNIVPYEGPDTGRGYRYYDRCNLTPLYPFGHGLSYTTFQYSNLRISPNPAIAGQDIVVSVDIQNTGTRAGEEVPQLYVHENAPQLVRPVKELRGFARVALNPGQLKTVSFRLRERELAYFDTRATATFAPYGQFVAQPDTYKIMVGPSSANILLVGTITLQSAY